MSLLCAYQFTVRPRPGETATANFASLRDLVANWVRTNHRANHPRVAFDGDRERPFHGHDVCATEHSCEAHLLATLEWDYPDPEHGSLFWQNRVTLASDRASVQVALTLDVVSKSVGQPAVKVQGLSKVVVRFQQLAWAILRRHDCWFDGEEIRDAPHRVQESGIESVVDYLLSEYRGLPALVVSFDNPEILGHKGWLRVQESLVGLSQMFLLDRAAQERLTSSLGPERACASQGVRIYWPGFKRDAPPEAHPWHSYCEFKDKPIDQHFYWLFARATVASFREGQLIRDARHAVTTRDRLIRNNPLQWADALLQEKNECLQRERDQARVEQQKLHREFVAASDQLRAANHERQVAELALAAVQERQRQLEQETETNDKELRALRRRLHAQERESKTVQSQVDGLQRNLAAARNRVQELDRELAHLQERQGETVNATPKDELYVELERSWDEAKRLWGELESSKRRITELEDELAAQKKSWALLAQPTVDSEDGNDEDEDDSLADFADVVQALHEASDDFADVLTVWDDARHAAEKTCFSSPAKVYQALRAIAEVARDYFSALNGGPPLGPVETAFRRRVPFKYTGFESHTTLSQFGDERVFRHDQQSRQMQRHLTLGGGQTNNCLQIYFEFDEANRRVLIGYCGRHLPFARMRT